MPINTRFREVLRSVLRGTSQSQIVERTGISPSYVHALVVKGTVPSREKLVQLVDGLALSPADRGKLFAAAGYASEEASVGDEVFPADVVAVAREMVPLSPQQRETVRRLIQHPERIDALGMLLDPRVMHPQVAGLGPAAAWVPG